jgi:Family of unknown function (DUF5335)
MKENFSMKRERKAQDDRKRAQVKGTASRRESGVPGGGRGRRDVVRGSGVYPASGPLPRGNAPIRTEAAWGQGTRGAAGYEDSGRSELSRRSQTTSRRGATSGRRRPLEQRTDEAGQEIPRSQWVRFLNNFSKNHDGWLAKVEVLEPGNRFGEETRTMPLLGITVDIKPGARNTTSVILGIQPNVHLTHMIPRTKRITFNENEQQIEIEAASGDKTLLHFEAPRRR